MQTDLRRRDLIGDLDFSKEEVETVLDVIVSEEQLSLAIGKRGQNVRLASRLLGCRIEIKSEEVVKDEVAAALAAMLRQVEGVAPGEEEAPEVEAPAAADEASQAAATSAFMAARSRVRIAC